ncbi:VOC family protein [Paracraurococcus ruber]|uniref:Biphenyl 2,3-dioxygenase n=1 Tax=Paracraurococcus ruber TaxID=77675 RepID=A0ABS1D6F9_9PROT|nr:VOC family protein [Paracraurococcus ruber]MBK1661910.1 biphenyl 2,3-dioxygenase [Paracraurococcus ruber]TDG33480.1 biphenyl 2,3-dioxygenase [Paracraurococcus ruber]
MTIQALGYVGIEATAPEDWAGYGTGFLGLMLAERSAAQLAFRMDDRRQRLLVVPGARDGARFFGWEVADAAALAGLAARLEAAGVPVARGDRALAGQRRVADLIVTQDPLGNRLEIVHGAEVTAEAFRPGRCISGFRTGALGMGHAVLTVPRMADALPFYRDLLGFGVSDYVTNPFHAYFLHVNPRHHSLALIETGQAGLHHLMVELFNLDDVGQGYDLAQGEEDRVATTIGRHTNDFMTSFYARTPGGFLVEYGWGGRQVDVERWTPVEMTSGPSLWGHDRSWGSPEMRAAARRLKLEAAARGERAPVQVLPGNHQLMPGECAWWEMVRAAAE